MKKEIYSKEGIQKLIEEVTEEDRYIKLETTLRVIPVLEKTDEKNLINPEYIIKRDALYDIKKNRDKVLLFSKVMLEEEKINWNFFNRIINRYFEKIEETIEFILPFAKKELEE